MTAEEIRNLKERLEENFFGYAAMMAVSIRALVREWKVTPYYDAVAYIRPKTVPLTLVWYRDDTLEYMRQVMDMTCVDHMDRENRFNIGYTGLSIVNQKRTSFITSVEERLCAVSSVSVFKSLNGAEREAGDMFGVPFKRHPNMRRILTDYGFRGFPLRKNFPMVGYGEKRGDAGFEAIMQKLVVLMQESRSVNPFSDFRVKFLGHFADESLMRLVREYGGIETKTKDQVLSMLNEIAAKLDDQTTRN